MNIEGYIYQSPYQDCELSATPVCQMIMTASQEAFLSIPAGGNDLQYFTVDPPHASIEDLPALLFLDPAGMVLGRLEGNQLTAANVKAMLLGLAEYQPDGQGGYTDGQGGVINAGQELQLLPGLGLGLNINWPSWRSLLVGLISTVVMEQIVKK